MRKIFLSLILVWFVLASGRGNVVLSPSLWQQINYRPEGVRQLEPGQYQLFRLQDAAMQLLLFSLSRNPAEAGILQLPLPGGQYRDFRVWETPVMEAELSEKYPQIKTFTAIALDDEGVTAKLDYSPAGFHAMIYEGGNIYFIDPYTNINDGYYQVYDKRDYTRSPGQRMSCELDGLMPEPMGLQQQDIPVLARMHGGSKRTYRLALACTGEYAVAVAGSGPTKAAVLARMVSSVNRVNGLYERELAVTMVLVANTDTLIFLDGSSDPYSNYNGNAMMMENQSTLNNRIGSGGYDIGHVFSTGGGGIAQKASVCNHSDKGKGVTGLQSPQGDPFDVDYVAHEIGHQFGADHTFNSNLGGCGSGNRVGSSAFEPGGGSTLMGYAGLCGADNLQGQSSTYFHAWSLMQITGFLATGGTCAVTTPAGNSPVSVPPFATSYQIPFLTPFEFSAPQATSGRDPGYCWESWDRSNTELSWSQTRLTGPIFRSFSPTTSPVRVFPGLPKLVQNITSYVGEKLPDTARLIRFRLTVRDYVDGLGSFNFPEDSVVLHVIRTSAPFALTYPNSGTVSWRGGSTQTVSWNVSETNLSPIACNLVDIYLSVDGGYTYPFVLLSQAPNTGLATVVVPNTASTAAARVKVKGHGNVFFDISNEDFAITHDDHHPYPSGVPEQMSGPELLDIYPVPASHILHVQSGGDQLFDLRICNVLGQVMWTGRMDRHQAIDVAGWRRGIYYLQLTDTERGQRIVKTVLIQ